MAKWIRFVLFPSSPDRKTKRWVVTTIGKAELDEPATDSGVVKWTPSWRRYAFYPEPQTLFEGQCLRDIAEFCEAETITHKAKRGDARKGVAG